MAAIEWRRVRGHPGIDQAIELESQYGKPVSVARSNRGEMLQLAGRERKRAGTSSMLGPPLARAFGRVP